MNANVPKRFYAPIHGTLDPPVVRHSFGFPKEISEGHRPPALLPWPHVVVMEQAEDGTVSLYRASFSGDNCGDTWHPNLEEAKEQAEFEYKGVLGEWKEIPGNIDDPVRFAIKGHSSR